MVGKYDIPLHKRFYYLSSLDEYGVTVNKLEKIKTHIPENFYRFILDCEINRY
jgi:hypothetical protein